MDNIRTPFFIVAVVLWFVILIGEASSSGLLALVESDTKQTQTVATDALKGQGLDDPQLSAVKPQSSNAPCYGIQKLTIIDGLIAYSLILMTVWMLKLERIKGYLQGIGTLILSLLAVIGVIVMIIAGIIKLLIMIALFMAVPFGTIAYLIVWGYFDRGGAAATLGAIMFLKIAFAVCLLLAQQDFVKNKSLVTLLLLSLLATFITSFLHALVPSILDNITDTIAGLINMVLGIIWLIILLIGSIIKTVKDILALVQRAA